jgi:KUP system potassium uptake protein
VFAHGRVPLTPENIYGVLSLVFWTLTVIVSLKYVALILRADNNGEGGLIAMLALASQAVRDRPELRRRLLLLGIFGTAIFFGDGVITPAISVLSAVEGLEVAAPGLHHYIVPITLLVLTALFLVQRHGSASVGKLFGPVTAMWFAVLTVLGVIHIASNPDVLWALSPLYALIFLGAHPGVAFIALGSVVLCVTGAEALYADMGHFGKRPIRLAWFGLVMPALVINYFGQGAMLLEHPENVKNPFYEMAPQWALYPLIALATCATVIASQALITAAFSVTKQAIQLGYLPRLRVPHLRQRDGPDLRALHQLDALRLHRAGGGGVRQQQQAGLGLRHRGDHRHADHHDDDVLRDPLRLEVPLVGVRCGHRLLLRGRHGVLLGQHREGVRRRLVPVAIGIVMFMLMMTWKQGRYLMRERLRDDAIDLKSFLEAVFVSPPTRVSGTAVFLVSDQGITPNALLHNLKHNKVLHETNLFVTVKHHEVPWIGFNRRCEMEPLGHDCWQVTLNFGFKNDPDVPEALALLRGRGVQLDDMETSYFLSRDIVIPTLGQRHDDVAREAVREHAPQRQRRGRLP